MGISLQIAGDFFKNLIFSHDEGVIGIDDIKLGDARHFSSGDRDDAIIVPLKERVKNSRPIAISHDDVSLEPGREAWEFLGNIGGGKAHPSGTEGKTTEGRFFQPVDDLASLVGRGKHNGFPGNEFGMAISKAAEDDAAHRVGHEVGGLVGGLNDPGHVIDDFIK